MVIPYLIFLVALGAERMVEIVISRRHAAWAFRRGAVEVGRGHLRWMQLLHTAFFFACAIEVWSLNRSFVPALAIPMAAAVVLAQTLRYWAIATLGPRWNIRAIVLPGAPAVVSGPYRFVRHPNYLAVVVEGFAVPLVHSAWVTAIGFALLNAWLLVVRIRCEEGALSIHGDYRARVANRPRFIPRWSPRLDAG